MSRGDVQKNPMVKHVNHTEGILRKFQKVK
jgi:hypothetical protein